MGKIKYSIGLLILATSSVALAATFGWSAAATLAQVEVDSTSATNGTSTFLGFTGGTLPTNHPTCATAVQGILAGSTDNVKAMTTLATAAFLAGRSVKVYWDGTCETALGFPNYGRIINIQMN
jgi:hypothetical protein